LAKRFPGRSSYPGDIFYVQARLIERAGNFKTGSITCLPVAESILGDLSGYIQTNLMAMTDGHIFFDIDLYNEGKRPAVSPFLSVTRVGHQAQSLLLKEISRELSSFLVKYDRMKQFMHFGAEVGENVRNTIEVGAKIDAFFNQSPDSSIPINVNVLILIGIWTGIWNEVDVPVLVREMNHLIKTYSKDERFRKQIDEIINSHNNLSELINTFRLNKEIILSKLDRPKKQ
jgi:F-type H+-transporting ATPase subunit alpha